MAKVMIIKREEFPTMTLDLEPGEVRLIYTLLSKLSGVGSNYQIKCNIMNAIRSQYPEAKPMKIVSLFGNSQSKRDILSLAINGETQLYDVSNPF